METLNNIALLFWFPILQHSDMDDLDNLY